MNIVIVIWPWCHEWGRLWLNLRTLRMPWTVSQTRKPTRSTLWTGLSSSTFQPVKKLLGENIDASIEVNSLNIYSHCVGLLMVFLPVLVGPYHQICRTQRITFYYLQFSIPCTPSLWWECSWMGVACFNNHVIEPYNLSHYRMWYEPSARRMDLFNGL